MLAYIIALSLFFGIAWTLYRITCWFLRKRDGEINPSIPYSGKPISDWDFVSENWKIPWKEFKD